MIRATATWGPGDAARLFPEASRRRPGEAWRVCREATRGGPAGAAGAASFFFRRAKSERELVGDGWVGSAPSCGPQGKALS